MISLSFAANVYFIIWCTASVQSESVCPYGWQWNNKNLCIINCDGEQGSSSPSNINCQLPLMASSIYNATDNTFTTEPGKSLTMFSTKSLPRCYNVTLTSNQFNITPEGEFQLNYYIPPIYSYNLDKKDENSITTCYPLSPQLQQCDIVVTNPGEYHLEGGTTLTIPSRNISAYLGDFYIGNKGVAYTCSQGVNVSLYDYPRCHYVTLSSDEYKMDSDGSVFIYKANISIKNPVYSFITGKFSHICIPLNIAFLNCPMKIILGPHGYDIDPSLRLNSNTALTKSFSPEDYYMDKDKQTVICFDDEDADLKYKVNIISYVVTALQFTSALCLIITLLLKIKFYHSNCHNKCLICHICCLIILYLFMALNPFLSTSNTAVCYFKFIVIYLPYMSALIWLTVISYDTWRSFTRLQISPYRFSCRSRCFRLNGDYQRFIMYNFYAWGMATLLIAIILIIDSVPTPPNNQFLNLQISRHCWFGNSQSTAIFNYTPAGLMMVINFIFFILTVHIIHHSSQGTDLVNHQRRKQMHNVTIKLFIVMGIFWVIEIIIDCVGFNTSLVDSQMYKMALASNIFISIQGIFILFAYLDKHWLIYFRYLITFRYLHWPKLRGGSATQCDTQRLQVEGTTRNNNTTETTL